jgi:hypothetical protein
MRKFAALAGLKNQAEEVSEHPILPITTEKPARAPGRPPGKRSNPDFDPTTIFLRVETKDAVAIRLRQEKRLGKRKNDLSVLVEELLQNWLET